MGNKIPETDEDDLRKRPDNEEDAHIKGLHSTGKSVIHKIDHKYLAKRPYKGNVDVSVDMRVAADRFLSDLSQNGSLDMLRSKRLIGLEPPEYPLAKEAYDLSVRLLQSADRIAYDRPVGHTRINWLYSIDSHFQKIEKKLDERLPIADKAERILLIDTKQGLQFLKAVLKESGLPETIPSPTPDVPGR